MTLTIHPLNQKFVAEVTGVDMRVRFDATLRRTAPR
jgi:hypothetical protein